MRSVRGPAVVGLVCALAVFVVEGVGWVGGLDARGYDLAMRLRRSSGAAPRVAVIEIDDESISLLGRWPWPRSVHAKFLAALREKYQPSAIVFDLLLSEAENRQQDAAFAREVEEAGNVYLAAFFTTLGDEGPVVTTEGVPWVRGEYAGESEWRGKRFAGLRPPIPEFARASAGVGHVNVFPELDGCVRRLPLVMDYESVPYLSLVGVVANSVVNPEGEPVSVALGEAVRLGDTVVPIDETGEIWVNYRREGRAAFDHVGYHSILMRDAPVSALRDKIALVGFGATGMADIHATPLTSGALGVDINAHALNALLEGAFIRPARWPGRFAFVVVWALAAAFAAGLWSPGRALGVAVALPVVGFGLAAWALSWKGVWLGAAGPGVAALVGYSVAVALRHRESEREGLRVRASVDALALATRVIGSARRRQDLLPEIRAQIHDATEALQVNSYMTDEETGRLTLLLPIYTERTSVSYEVGEGTVGWVAQHRMMHMVDQVQPGSELAGELARSVGFPVGSVLYAPMMHRGKVVGVMEAVRGQADRPFEQRHLHMLEALATEAAVALENVALYEKLEGRVELANRKLLAAYQELKQERDRISAIVSNMADGIILTDGQQRVAFINPAASQMFGVEVEQAQGRAVSEVLPYPALLEQLEDGPPTSAHIPRIHLTEPRRMTLSPRTVRLRQEGGARTGAITVVSDITLLEELSEMKTEFVSVVSHELRTPLTSIMGFAQTLRGDPDTIDAEERGEFLGIIEQESNRLLVMINDLLDMSRMEAGRPLPVNYAEVEVEELSRHVVRFQSVTTTAHRFRFEFPEDGVSVRADPDKVEQVLTNLVSNAIKYSPKGGVVVIGGRCRDDECVVYVRDEGLGMGPEETSRLFERYQRIDRDAIKGIRGTGLGLYLVRALVEAHGGRVWVESEPGKGSTFSFSLPRRPAGEEATV
ncbi:MAG TPA: CHASE2 domain-containing protein [Armatimonadota bacterium]|nr:CHASE2 domain-containing protein [Armatimonadota bacterium]